MEDKLLIEFNGSDLLWKTLTLRDWTLTYFFHMTNQRLLLKTRTVLNSFSKY